MKIKKFPFTKQARAIFKALLAGALIAMAGGIFLGCLELIPDPAIAKVVGAGLFSIGLIAVLVLEANLFTGKIGYVDSWKKLDSACKMLLFNLAIAFFIGMLYRGLHSNPEVGLFAPVAINPNSKLAKDWYMILADGFGCGVLIYLAVELYKKTKNLIPVIICVMAFILSGAEHSIADAFYLGTSILSLKGFGYLGLVIIGNALGSISIHWLQVGAEKLVEVPTDL